MGFEVSPQLEFRGCLPPVEVFHHAILGLQVKAKTERRQVGTLRGPLQNPPPEEPTHHVTSIQNPLPNEAQKCCVDSAL